MSEVAKEIRTRQDMADLLASIGKPGEKRDEKFAAVAELNKQNYQGHDVTDTLESYVEF